MSTPSPTPFTLLDAASLDAASEAARTSPRGRKNRNFHRDDEPCHRLINGIEPGSYIQPHRHLHPDKDEAIIILRGRLGLIVFDEAGNTLHTAVLAPYGEPGTATGANLPHGTWHTVFALESGTVFFESKAGPWLPLTDAEKAAWAPAEGDPACAEWLARWASRL